jgi:hypothetical protein
MIKDATIRTISCDGPACDKQVIFDQADKSPLEKPENEWLKNSRIVSTNDGRVLAYCSDTCEVDSITAGKHNIQEQPKVHTNSNPAAIALAAQAAARARQADQALRDGKGGNIQVTPR